MNLKILLGLLVLVAILAFPAEFILRGPKSVYWMGFSPARQKSFEKIPIGEPVQKTIDLLGVPHTKTEFFPRQIDYRESEFSSIQLGSCHYYLVWVNGGNWYYCVGVDRQGKVVLKADGHS